MPSEKWAERELPPEPESRVVEVPKIESTKLLSANVVPRSVTRFITSI